MKNISATALTLRRCLKIQYITLLGGLSLAIACAAAISTPEKGADQRRTSPMSQRLPISISLAARPSQVPDAPDNYVFLVRSEEQEASLQDSIMGEVENLQIVVVKADDDIWLEAWLVDAGSAAWGSSAVNVIDLRGR